MSASTPPSPRPEDLPALKGPNEPLQTEEVASVSGGLFVSTVWYCEIHPRELHNHKLPDGTICPG